MEWKDVFTVRERTFAKTFFLTSYLVYFLLTCLVSMLLQQCWQLWLEALCFSGCLSVRPILVNSISQEHLEWISPQIWHKKTHHHDSKMHRLEFGSQRSEVKVTVTSQNTCWRQHMKKYLIGLKWWGCNIWYPEGWSQIQTTRIELIWFTRFARSKLARQIYRRTRCHHSTQHVGRTNASGAVQIRSGPDAFWVKCSAEKKKKVQPISHCKTSGTATWLVHGGKLKITKRYKDN